MCDGQSVRPSVRNTLLWYEKFARGPAQSLTTVIGPLSGLATDRNKDESQIINKPARIRGSSVPDGWAGTVMQYMQ